MDNKTLYPLTHPQKRIWYTEKLHPGISIWNNAGTLKIKGVLDIKLMERAINLFVKNNEAMRIRITEIDGQPQQYVMPYSYIEIDYFDFCEKGLQSLFEWDSMQTQSCLPFLDSDLFYNAIVKISAEEFIWYSKVHHIISDAWSLVMFANQVMEYYNLFLAGADPVELPGGSYIEYIEREKEYLNSNRFEFDKRCLNEKFCDSPEPSVLKQKKVTYNSLRARRKAFIINDKLTASMRAYCQEQNVSIFSLFLASLCIYINRILNKDDIIIGVPVFNRAKEDRNTVGMFVSTVPIRIKVDDSLQFDEFVKVVSNEWFRILKLQKYPYEMLLQDLRKTNKELDSLYDITLSYQNARFDKTAKNLTYEGRWHFSGYQANSLSIHINDREGDGRLILDYDHLVPLFSVKEIEYVHNHCVNILKDSIAHPHKRLYELRIMSPEELKRILKEFNSNRADYPQNLGLDALFLQQATRTPDEIALIAGTDVLTYRQMNGMVNKAAHYLKSKGIGQEDIVGIIIAREYILIVSILAVIRAGAAFLPIDPDFPADRIQYELQESGAKCAIASKHLAEKCDGICEVVLAEELAVLADYSGVISSNNCLSNLAYVIYTSGSTGKPKGVMVEQGTLIHYLYAVSEIMNFASGSIVLSATTVSFDIFIMETFPTLLNGGTVVLAGENEHSIPRNLVSLMARTRINSILTTPSRMQLILSDKDADECLKNIKEIMLGGDVLQNTLLAEIQEKTPARILHFYGPTEITIAATYKDVTDSKVVNIGKPLPDVYAYILDKHKNPVPIGVHGELYIGGLGVSRGYLNRPDMTVAAFLENPFRKGERMYKTGDITRWFPMGEIEFFGRADHQVKIRGFRIELGEIETKLLQIDGISSCAVLDRQYDNGRKYLCAYICGTQRKNISQIREDLAKDLPAYMVPSYFVWMDSLPLSVSGKVDKTKLPEPYMDEHVCRNEFMPPRTLTEQILAEIWENVLKVKKIGRLDSFFDVGGDSLAIVMVFAEVYKRFKVEVSLEKVYENPTLENYAMLIDHETQKTDSRPILKVSGKKGYPVSAAQKQIYIVSGGGFAQNIVYNIPGAYHIQGNLDIPALERAFIKLIARNESLRTCFDMKNGVLRQRIKRKVDFKLQVQNCPKHLVKQKLQSLVQPFNLETAPLFRVFLLRLDENDSILFIDIHHIIADGTSAGIILSQLSRLYAGKSLPAADIGYKDYSVWQEDYLLSEHAEAQRTFWKEKLSGDLPTLNFHTDYPRGAVQSLDGSRLTFILPKELTLKMRMLAQRSGVTMYMLLLSVYSILLSKYTGQNDIIIGTPVSLRNRHELMDIIGMFVNTIPMRNQLNGDEKFSKLLERVHDNCIEAFQNQTYPFEMMVNDLRIEKDLSRNPIFGTMLVYNTFDVSSIGLKDLKTKVVMVNQPISKFDITLEVYDKDTTLACDFEYCTRLFKKETVQAMALHFRNLIELAVNDPDIQISKICLLTKAEQKKILCDFNCTTHDFDESIPVIRLFERAVDRYPNKAALICGEETMTFAELDRAAGCYAKRLMEFGVGREDIVGISINRSIEMMCAILGTLKTGAAYMPVDPFYPEERTSYMLKTSGAKILVTDNPDRYEFDGKLISTGTISKSGPVFRPDIYHKPEDLAIVIFTSGSTGKPKGVMVETRGLLNLVKMIENWEFYSENSVVASISSISFDIFVSDSLISLFFGAAVVICREDECRQPHMLAAVMRSSGVNFLQTTPSRMQILMKDKSFRDYLYHLNTIVHGGEPFPPEHLRKLKRLTRGRIISVYGPTETTVYSSRKDLTHSSNITVGEAALNLQYYILDKDLVPVPVGCPGLLYIGGKNVSRGYINREDLTRERYISNPFSGGIMYNTGDICVFQPSGEAVCLGRADFQVKIRGLRIELGEIESAILEYRGIEKAVVVALGKEESKYLCAYYTKKGEVDDALLRESLRKLLPVYMIPSYLVALDHFPMTPGGKLDRKALPDPENLSHKKKKPAVKAMNATQRKMAKVWQQVLKVETVLPEDNFFHLGGDSLAVIQVQIAILKHGFQIKTQDFYELQTLEAICTHIDNKQAEKETADSCYDAYVRAKKDVPVPFSNPRSLPADLHCVLLTGATGFLGAHILAELIELYNSKVYCIIRGENKENCVNKLRKSLGFYFGDNEADKYLQNIQVVCGDITKTGLGIPEKEYEQIAGYVSSVIHCAAFTNHYGMAEIFEKTNILGTENITNFCKKLGKSLLYVSTMSVSGQKVLDHKDKPFIFDETSYYIGQEYTGNQYMKSKFLAEGIVLKAGEEGLDIRIFRVGNLTARASDGKFQMKKSNNAFANRLKSVFEIGAVPEKLVNMPLEFTPVDACAKAMLLLSRVGGAHPLVFHLYNDKKIAFGVFLHETQEVVQNPVFVSQKAFDKIVRDYGQKKDSAKLSGIIIDMDGTIGEKRNIQATSNRTAEFLNSAGFHWPSINTEYITRFVKTICDRQEG